MHKQYTVDYFLKKFKAIPKKYWATGELSNGETHCALGHCNVIHYDDLTPEAVALGNILKKHPQAPQALKRGKDYAYLYKFNDGQIIGFDRNTPKENMIKALTEVKNLMVNKTTNSRVKQSQVAPGITLNPSKKNKYRARKSVNGQRISFYTNNLKKAKEWLKNID